MKFQYRDYGRIREFDSVSDYLSIEATNRSFADGYVERVAQRAEYLEAVLGRLLDTLTPQLSLGQISAIVAGYDQNLELQDGE